MLTLFGYSMVALFLVVFNGHNLPRSTKLLLSLAILILLIAPTWLVKLLQPWHS